MRIYAGRRVGPVWLGVSTSVKTQPRRKAVRGKAVKDLVYAPIPGRAWWRQPTMGQLVRAYRARNIP
jgi:hypothetical protein